MAATRGVAAHDASSALAQIRSTRLAKAAEVSGDAATVQIATMTFVAFVDDPSHREWVLERAERVIEKHPARFIVLDSTDAVDGFNVSLISRHVGNVAIVNERVDVGVRSRDHAAIVSLVQELSVPDVPLVLWWSGARLLRSRTFSGIAALAQRVLVDSSGQARDEETIRELGEFANRFPNASLQDLAFMRLLPWQDIIAQFFDDDALREDLFSIDSLRIESGSDAEALYLAGWLASRLSWEPAGRDAFRDRRGNDVVFEMIEKGDQRRVHSVLLTARRSRYRAALCDDDDRVVCLTIDGPKAKPMWHVPLHSIDNISLIERAILEKPSGQIFETSLLAVRDVLR